MKYQLLYRRLLLAALSLLFLLPPQHAMAADFSAGVSNTGGAVAIWFQSNVGSTMAIASYKINGAAQQNVGMSSKGGGRFELPINASAGDSVSIRFTYSVSGGTERFVDFSPYTVPSASGGAGKVLAPTFDPPGGSYGGSQSVTVKSATAGAALVCSINGGPYAACAGAIAVSATTTITASASKAGMTSSDASSATYTIGSAGGAPTHGVLDNGSSLILWMNPNTASTGAIAHYTLNTAGKENKYMALVGGRYELPITVTAGTAVTLQYEFDYMHSGGQKAVAGATWTRAGGTTINPPVVSPAAGAIAASQAITLSGPPGASVLYTIDGRDPATYGAVYSAPFTLAAPGATVKAVAKLSGATSAVASAVFTVTTSGAPRHGVKEAPGMTARTWIELPASASLVEAHIRTGSRSIDEKMVFNSQWQRWESLSFGTAPGMDVSYFFVYRLASTGGNTQSPDYRYTVCASGATSPGCPGSVPKPVFSLPGGTYSTAKTVTLSLAPGAPAGAKLYYTMDGSPASPSALLYEPGRVLTISKTTMLSAIAVHPDGDHARDAQSYVIEAPCASSPAGCTVAAPVFSHPAGSYASETRLNMMTATIGARVHYTLDGSVPTAASPQFREAFSLLDLRAKGKGNTYLVSAVAIKDGVSSAITERSYTITSNARQPWSGLTKFKLQNNTGLPANEVYWFMIGKRWLPEGTPDQFVRVGRNGELIDIKLADNTITFVDPRGGVSQLADYNFRLDEVPHVSNVPAIRSARIYMSVKKPVLVQVKVDETSGLVSYAGPNLQNWADPNIETRFEFAEFNINEKTDPAVPGIFINTSRVDLFSFPVQLNVTGEDGYTATVGESMEVGADEIFAAFAAQSPEEFHNLYQVEERNKNIKRLVAPAHGDFHGVESDKNGNVQREAGANEHYLDDYISEVWNKYRHEPLTILLADNPVPFIGTVGPDDVLSFNDGLGIYKIRGKPATDEVLLGKGLLDDSEGLGKGTPAYHKQLQLQAQVCAALNRHVAHLPSAQWHKPAAFYPAGSKANWFAAFFHRYSINALAYGFAYDDVGHQSPSIYTPQPKEVTYSLGKVDWK